MPDMNLDLDAALNSPSGEEKNEEERVDDVDGFDGEETGAEGKDKDEEAKVSEGDDDAAAEELNFEELDLDEDKELLESAPVNLAQLNKQYPKLLKEYPGLREAIVREQKFTEVFPTIEMAEEAYQRSESFKNFNAEIMSGQSSNLLAQIHKLDGRTFDKFTSGLLESVRRVDQQQYQKLIAPVLSRAIKHVFAEGGRYGNEDLQLAAKYFSHVLFGKKDPNEIEEPKPDKADEDSEERVKIQRERDAWLRERYDVATQDIAQQIDGQLTKLIGENLDPHNRLSPFAKEALVNRIANDLDLLLSKNPRHASTMRALWERASKNAYSAEWRNKIRDAVIESARRLLPTVRQKRFDEAIKSNKPGKVNESKIVPSGRQGGSKSNGAGKSTGPRKIDYSKTTDEDILNGRITYK